MADVDELLMLRESVRRAAAAERATGEPDLASTWRHVSEIGWGEAFIPRADGVGAAEAVTVVEECGRCALPLGVTALVVGLAAAMRSRAAGSNAFGNAVGEHHPVAWAGKLPVDYWQSSSADVVVPAVDVASYVLVTSHDDSHDVSLWRSSDITGASTRVESIDGDSPTWLVRVDDDTRACAIARASLLGSQPDVELDFVRNLSMLVAAAQATGLLDRALQATLEYALDRTAFGRPIGSFQAVKHMLADTKVALEAARAIVADAVKHVDSRDPSANLTAAIAARFVGRSVLDGLQVCVQVHGGIGVTMECELHTLLRRATALRFLYMEPFASGRRILDSYAGTETVHA